MISRRSLIQHALVVNAGLAAADAGASGWFQGSPNNRVRLGVMGLNGRGSDLIGGFLRLKNVEVAALCDVDLRALDKGRKAVAKGGQSREPKTFGDFRRMLEDPEIDAVVIAAPDHWHAHATILACQAGKHVYCEKPASHNPHEGELMVAAARKHRCVVQIGTQRRSSPGIQEAVARLRSGELGRVLFARGWYNNVRPSIGRGKTGPAPEGLDWNLWQGPAPEQPFRNNVVHYNWHWFWNWGTGELCNNGVHSLDVCRWGMGVDLPRRVTSGGGKFRHADDGETPDTQVVTFEYDGGAITWETRNWSLRGFENTSFGIAFYGERGSLAIDWDGYVIYDEKDREIKRVASKLTDEPHLQNFVDCVRSRARPNADVEEGVRSTLMCHLGNMAWRTGRTVNCDPKTGRILNDRAQQSLWRRDYRKGWEPKV